MTLNINESASAQRQQAQRRSSNYPSFYYVANMPSNRYVRQPQQDTYIPSEKKNNKIKMPALRSSGNKLQTASAVAGIAASTLIAVTLLRSSGLFNRNKDILLDQIKKFEAPEKVKEKLLIEFNKMKNSVVDADTSKNYIDNVMRLNFKDPEMKIVDTKKAKEILDSELIGMEKAKKQVIDFLEERNYNINNKIEQNNGPLVLCLDGPPGVGKTSIAEYIAKAMGVPFERISLAGTSDSMAIKGLKKGYKDATPGELIKAFQDAKCKDPVILFDEMDKMGASREHGSPAAALLDVLEPKQCKNFTDAYLEFPYDLSKATFIITSNDLNNIDKTLLDRMKVINMEALQASDKKQIASKFMDKIFNGSKLESHGVKKFTDDAIDSIVSHTDDFGARKTIQNSKDVIKQAKVDIERGIEGKDIVIDKKYVNKVLEQLNGKEN